MLFLNFTQKTMSESKPLPLQYMKGVGPKRAEALASAGLLTAADMLRYYPRSYIDRNRFDELFQRKV